MDTKLLQRTLDELHAASNDIMASAIVSTDGLPVVSVLDYATDRDRVGSSSAALLNLCRQTARLLSCGNFDQTMVKADKGQILLTRINDNFVLICTIRADAHIAISMVQVREALSSLRRYIDMK